MSVCSYLCMFVYVCVCDLYFTYNPSIQYLAASMETLHSVHITRVLQKRDFLLRLLLRVRVKDKHRSPFFKALIPELS